ncbi:hypothetical protein [Nocardia sp. NBC_00511]|uniref:hypothetical protein n=1 Tax=Nocardia sp. NBC_00511 TaxID=2903591 RepID=UPI0030DF0811
MGLLPSAIGYLRTDVSGLRQSRDESRILGTAKRTGYDLRKTVAFSGKTDRPMHRLRVVCERMGVGAVIVPNLDHFENRVVPAELLEVAAVVIVDPLSTLNKVVIGDAVIGKGD